MPRYAANKEPSKLTTALTVACSVTALQQRDRIIAERREGSIRTEEARANKQPVARVDSYWIRDQHEHKAKKKTACDIDNKSTIRERRAETSSEQRGKASSVYSPPALRPRLSIRTHASRAPAVSSFLCCVKTFCTPTRVYPPVQLLQKKPLRASPGMSVEAISPRTLSAHQVNTRPASLIAKELYPTIVIACGTNVKPML